MIQVAPNPSFWRYSCCNATEFEYNSKYVRTTSASVDPGFHATGAACLFDHLTRYRRNENTSACAQVLAAAAIWYERFQEEAAIVDAGGSVTVRNSVYAEIGAAIGCSVTVAHAMVEVGIALPSQFPMILDSFDTGMLDFARVRVVVDVLRGAGADTIAAIETEVHAAAMQFTPRALRTELWRLWTAAAPEEARAARERNTRDKRTAYVRRGNDGLSWLTAAITDLEGAEADRILDEIAGTVCPTDPRSRNELRADGLMALLHGESFLVCRCGDRDCPNSSPPSTPRRGYLMQIVVDIRTLLGLSNDPARLGDGTATDPDLARILAQDSTWQAILAELRATVENNPARPETSEPQHDSAEHQPESGGEVPLPSPVTWLQPTHQGRTHPPGAIAYGTPLPTAPDTGAAAVIADWLAALDRDPALRRGIDPTGHGGHTTPPDGALRYRPTKAVAALVRAVYPTCVFPGCCVPSAKCELDHRVPFDHADPAAGGWTILENLQPLCKRDHDIKTRRLWACVPLAGGVILWTSPQHTRRITLPAQIVTGNIPQPPEPLPPDEYDEAPTTSPPYSDDELLYEMTWWEHMFRDQPPLTPRQLADEPYLHQRYLEHRAVTDRRDQLQPAPF